jgi:hypothetical protein
LSNAWRKQRSSNWMIISRIHSKAIVFVLVFVSVFSFIISFACFKDHLSYQDNITHNSNAKDMKDTFSMVVPSAISKHSHGHGAKIKTKSTSTTTTRNKSTSKDLPQWIQDYTKWHQKMRAKFPGKALFEDPNAPPLLVRLCFERCGGLHDRLGQLPLDLFLANQTQRVLLIKWIEPKPLEEFLIPPTDNDHNSNNHGENINENGIASISSSTGIDWVFPKGVDGWGEMGTTCQTFIECTKEVRAQPSIVRNVLGNRKKGQTLAGIMEESIEDLNNGKNKNVRAVTYGIVGHMEEEYLEGKLKKLGEADLIHSTASFGNIFRLFFQPHPNVQKEIDRVNKLYGLVPHEYSIAHCRVRHPKAYDQGQRFNGKYIANADMAGLPFEGKLKESAVDVASRAISCVATLPDVEHHPIYFMGDESALVQYMTRDLMNKTYVDMNPDLFSDKESSDSNARNIVSKYKVVARDQDIPNAHIDRNRNRPTEAYYATFVDLYVGINAKCVSFGLGRYAMFAAKLSGTDCTIRYATEKWGTDRGQKLEVKSCSLPERPYVL